MPITVACPKCKGALQAPETAAGLNVKCSICGTVFPVPAAAPLVLPAVRAVPEEYQPRAAYEGGYGGQRAHDRTPGNTLAGTGLQTGLGIASLVLGIVGLLIAFIPLVGIISLPVTGLGLLLGVVALIVAIVRNGQGLAFPIAGSSVNAVAILIALVYVLLIGRVVTGMTENAKKKTAQVQVRTTLTTAVIAYHIDHSQYPQSLQQLLQKDNFGGPYLTTSDAIIDPWGNPYQYNASATNPETGVQEPEISMTAPDGTRISNLGTLKAPH